VQIATGGRVHRIPGALGSTPSAGAPGRARSIPTPGSAIRSS